MNSQYIKQQIIDKCTIENDIFKNFFHTDVTLELKEPVILEAKHAYHVYDHRNGLQKEVTKSKISGYEPLLKNLKEQNDEISIYQINTEIGFVACFFDAYENLLGVLWNPDK